MLLARIEKLYLAAAAVLLAAAAVGKLASVVAGDKTLSEPDPLFRLNTRLVLGMAAALELGVAGYLLKGRDQRAKHVLLLGFCLNALLYRLGIWWFAPLHPCRCLGRLSKLGWSESDTAERLLGWVLLGMLVTSGLSLTGQALSRLSGKVGPRTRLWVERSAIIALIAALIPPLQVACVGLFDPPTTVPMILRAVQARILGRQQSSNCYVWKSLGEIPSETIKTFLVAEDRIFFRHDGFNWQHVRMTLQNTLATGEALRGGSTISQQCARSLFLWQGRSWIRKGWKPTTPSGWNCS